MKVQPCGYLLLGLLTAVSVLAGGAFWLTQAPATAADVADKAPQGRLRVDPPAISTDKTVKYDYDIVYVRAPRFVKGKDGKEQQAHVWPNAAEPEALHASTDLMLLHPDGSQEVLVEGGKGAIADPYVSFDAKWVYYSYFLDTSGHGGLTFTKSMCRRARSCA